MSDIGVAEIPVTDDDELSLPPIAVPVKNALVDGPILRTLLWLAWPNVIALSAGTCVVIAETSYIGRLGVEALAAIALGFPCVMLTMTMSWGRGGGGGGAARHCARAGRRRQGSRLDAGHACAADRPLLRVDLHAGHADLRLQTSGIAGRPRQRAGAGNRLHADLLWRRRAALADADHGGNSARHRQYEAAVAA